MVEQTRKHAREQINLVQGLIAARRLTGPDFKEKEGDPALADSVIRIARVKSSKESTEYMACIDIALTRLGFLGFLNSVSPNRLSAPGLSSIPGIVDDWALPDSRGDRLNSIHSKGLGAHWERFEQSRKLFMKILNTPDSPPTIDERIARRFMESLVVPGNGFLSRGIYMQPDDLSSFFGRPAMTDILNKLIAIIRRPTGKKLTDPFSALEADERIKYLRRLYHESHRPLKRILDREYALFEPNLSETREEGEEKLWKMSIGSDRVSSEAVVRVKGGDIQVDLDLSTLRWRQFIMPFMHWTTDSEGKRTWHFEFIPRGRLPEEIRNAFDKRSKNREETLSPRLNPIAGLLAIAHFSPEITERWPKEMGLPGGAYMQRMAHAQVPILAMMDRKLLTSNFLIQLEEYAEALAI